MSYSSSTPLKASGEPAATSFREAFDLGRMGSPAVDRPDGGKTVFVPAGTVPHQIEPLEKPLPRIEQEVIMHDKDSFLAYVSAFKDERTRLFAEPGFLSGGAAHITAVFDYHHQMPDYCAHVAKYSPRYSDQWTRWKSACGPPLKQAAFAEFIEEVRADIREPGAAMLLDIVRTFKANKKTDFDSLTYTTNGDVVLSYSEKTEQTGKSGPLPETMKIVIPVYFRGAPWEVPIFVRYRVEGGGVTFQLKADRSDIVEDTAFTELAKAIGEASGIVPFLGRLK